MRAAQQRSDSVIRVADWYETCSTRDRAKRFYPHLRARLDEATVHSKIILSFEGVEFVSPSFLDEILVTLAKDRPDVVKRLEIRYLSPFTKKRLRSILRHRDLLELDPQEKRDEYQLA